MKETPVKVDIGQCKKVAAVLKKLSFRPEFYKREFLTFKADNETKLRAYLYSVAICHQTHSLINRKKSLKGWDYLEHVFLGLAKENSCLLDPSFLSSLSPKELSEMLKPVFSEDGNPAGCTLDRLGERSGFMIEAATILKRDYDGRVSKLIGRSGGFLINKGHGLYESLEKLGSFSDPFRKKSTFLIKLIIDAGFLEIKDPENIIPIMDYQMQRVLLRMGCVEIVDKSLRSMLQNREKLDSDKEVRQACITAIKELSEYSGHPIIVMNDFFWPLGRSCCKEKTLCIDKSCSKNPCTFDQIVDIPSHDTCLFEQACKASSDKDYRIYWQPIIDTHFY